MRILLVLLTLFITNTSFAYECETPNNKFVCAQEYAYKCGFGLGTIYKHLEDYDAYSPSLTQHLFSLAYGDQIDMFYCEAASELIKDIGHPNERSNFVNTYHSYLNIYILGYYLKSAADYNKDNIVDNGYAACFDHSNSEQRNIGESFINIHKSGMHSKDEELQALSTFIEVAGVSLEGIFSTYNFLEAQDGNSMTLDHLKGVMTVINESESGFGLGSCFGNLTQCLCY